MPAKKIDVPPIQAEEIAIIEALPVPPSPSAGGSYRQAPETGELVRVEYTKERNAQ